MEKKQKMQKNMNCPCRGDTGKNCSSCTSSKAHRSDEEIWASCKSDNLEERRAALELLYDRYAPVILVCFINKLKLEDVRDLIHDLFLKLMEDMDDDEKMPRNIDNMRSFLYGVAYNLWRNMEKKTTRRAQLLRQSHFAESDGLVPGADELYAISEIMAIINDLPNKHKEILNLIVKGFRSQEIAAELEVSVKRVYAKAFAARQSLKERL